MVKNIPNQILSTLSSSLQMLYNNQTWFTQFDKRTKHTSLKNIYLSFYSRERHTVCVCLRDRWRDIYSEGPSSCPISSSWSQGVPTLAPPCKPYHQRWPNASDQMRSPHSTLDSHWTQKLSKNLTAWFSYQVVSFQLHTCSTSQLWHTAISLFTNHNMTASQSTWGHQEQNQNPCQQSLYNTKVRVAGGVGLD